MRPDAILGRTRTALSTVPRWILALFALGVAVRIALMLVYVPAALQNGDAIAYVTYPPFFDSRQGSGLHMLFSAFDWTGSLTVLVLVQHVLGVVTAVLLAAAARRAGCGWPATGAVAGVSLFASNVLYLEHALLTEPLFTTLAAGALLAVVPARGSAGGMRSALVAGAAASASLCTRSAGLVVIAAVVAGVLLVTEGPALRRAARSAVAVAGAAIVLGSYVGAVAVSHHGQSGIGQWSGWYAYARVAQFADCRAFTPPPGTKALCESSDAATRPGPSFYMFNPASPARVAFRYPPLHGDLLGSFGRAAMLGQPRAYANAVLNDFLRYFDDGYGGERVGSGGGWATVALDFRYPDGERRVTDELSGSAYGPVDLPRVKATNALELYATLLAIDGRVLLALLVLSTSAVLLARGLARRVAALYLVVGLALLAIPVMTIIYNARYAIPAALLLTVPAAVGTEALAARLRDGARRRRTTRSADAAVAR